MKIFGIMGIINCTPDSFYAQSQSHHLEKAIARALQMEKEGAAFIDVGGESTRPGATLVSEEEELERVLPLMIALKKSFAGFKGWNHKRTNYFRSGFWFCQKPLA